MKTNCSINAETLIFQINHHRMFCRVTLRCACRRHGEEKIVFFDLLSCAASNDDYGKLSVIIPLGNSDKFIAMFLFERNKRGFFPTDDSNNNSKTCYKMNE